MVDLTFNSLHRPSDKFVEAIQANTAFFSRDNFVVVVFSATVNSAQRA